jgi:hypothetical protein
MSGSCDMLESVMMVHSRHLKSGKESCLLDMVDMNWWVGGYRSDLIPPEAS